MSLPSQATRANSGRSSVFRAKRQSGSSRFAFVSALVIMLGIWAFMDSGAGEEVLAAHDRTEQPGALEPALGEQVPVPVQTSAADWLDDVRLAGTQTQPVPVAPKNQARPVAAGPAPAGLARGMAQLKAGDLVAGRRTLSVALLGGGLSKVDAERVRRELGAMGLRWILGSELLPGDPFSFVYSIASGDLLSRLPRSQKLDIDWRFLQRINGIEDPARLRLGQKIKLVRGAFHVVVHKAAYRMDLFLGEPGERIFVRSFPVGHGEANSTPEGLYQVRKNSKLINPAWTNPRTKQKVAAEDPDNPIGEHWIGLEGISDGVREVQSLGIHGTTDLPSIGQMRSMGCVRMRAADVALIYEVLVRPASSIEIRS